MKDCKRISIIGTDGAGKTTLARVLGKELSLPVIHMDSYIWGKDWTLNDKGRAENQIKNLLHDENWIAEGYMSYAPQEMLELADLVIYLNYSNTRALFRTVKRWIKHRRNKREELPEGCEEKFDLLYLYQILKGNVVHHIEGALKKYPPRELIRMRSPKQLKIFLDRNL